MKNCIRVESQNKQKTPQRHAATTSWNPAALDCWAFGVDMPLQCCMDESEGALRIRKMLNLLLTVDKDFWSLHSDLKHCLSQPQIYSKWVLFKDVRFLLPGLR